MTLDPLRKVLVALDGSERSFEVIKYISRMPYFRSSETKICLFSVYDAIPKAYQDLGKEPLFRKSFGEVQRWEIQKKNDLEKFLSDAKDSLIQAGIIKANIRIKLQKKTIGIARDIIKEAHSGYGAVMIGRKGEGMMKNVLFGSVAMKLLSGITDLPLALIGRDIPATAKIIAALDNSEHAMKAVDFIAANLSGKGFMVYLTHVIRDDMNTPADLVESMIHEIAPILNEAKSRLLTKGFNDTCIFTKVLTRQRSRAQAIMDMADNENIGTIVIGRRGINKLVEFFMGRVSNKIVQMARFNAVWIIT